LILTPSKKGIFNNYNMTGEKKFYLTLKGFKKIKKEYETLKALRAAKTNEGAPMVLESEDLNPEFLSFHEDVNLLNIRLAELENVFKNIELIKVSSRKKRNVIDLGATVEVETNKDKDRFTIVGTLEADPATGKISNESPIGQALLGHRIGDEIIVPSPVKTVYKIRKIKYNEI